MGVLTAEPIPAENIRGAILAYENLLNESTTVDAQKALTPNTYERWRPSSGVFEVKFQISNASAVDFIGLAAHDFAGETVTVSTAETVGGAQTVVSAVAFTNNKPVLLTFDSRNIAEVILSGTFLNDTELGVISAGAFLQMPVSVYGGHSPINLSRSTNYQSNESDTGQFLGRTITKKGTRSQYNWQHIEPDYYRDTFDLFVQSATRLPFFIQWRPVEFPEEVSYVHTTGDIRPVNMGGGSGLMSVSMSVRGHSDI